jgi:hypothetical protein
VPYGPSPRRYSEALVAWAYPEDHQLRQVDKDGYMLWRDKQVYLSEALAREQVAVAQRDDGDWSVRFRAFDLATLPVRKRAARTFPAGPIGPAGNVLAALSPRLPA